MTKAVLLKMSDVKSGTIVNVGPISSEMAIPRVPLQHTRLPKMQFHVYKIHCSRTAFFACGSSKYSLIIL